jgi:hypothetical protein
MHKIASLLLFIFIAVPVYAQALDAVTPEPTIQIVTATPSETALPNETATPDNVSTVTPESTATVTPDTGPSDTQIDPKYGIDIIINTVIGLILSTFGTAPITVVIVSILKRIPALDRFSAPSLTFATASLLYVAGLTASYFRLDTQFQSILDAIVVIAPAIVSLVGTLIAAPAQYHVAKAAEVPVIGESRKPDSFNLQDF